MRFMKRKTVNKIKTRIEDQIEFNKREIKRASSNKDYKWAMEMQAKNGGLLDALAHIDIALR